MCVPRSFLESPCPIPMPWCHLVIPMRTCTHARHSLWSATRYCMANAACWRSVKDACVTSPYALAMLSSQLQNFHCCLSILLLSKWLSKSTGTWLHQCSPLTQATPPNGHNCLLHVHHVARSFVGSSMTCLIFLFEGRVYIGAPEV